MFQKILLAYNGSIHSAAALEQAADLARSANAELHILGIVVTTGVMILAQGEGVFDIRAVERNRIQQAVETAAIDLGNRGVNVVSNIREGEPVEEIVSYAYKIRADLAVLGHTEKGVIARWFQGSIGAQLLDHLPCSLLIVTHK
jgi:nucleotide-binding universal stress UspA family protein